MTRCFTKNQCRRIFVLFTSLFIISLGIVSAQGNNFYAEAQQAFKEGDFKTAMEYANITIRGSNFTQAQRRNLYYIRGYGLYLANNYKEAIEDFEIVLDVKMDKPSQLLKAESYFYLNKFERAIGEFNITLGMWKPTDLNYENMIAYIKTMRAKCYYKMGKYNIAEEDLNTALKTDSTLVDIWETFGDVYFTHKNYDTAIGFYSKAINIYNINRDNSTYAYLWRGKCYDSLAKFDEALNNYQQVIKLKPESREAYWLTADCYEKKNDINSSLKYYRSALERTDSADISGSRLLNRNMGLMFKKKNLYDSAIVYFNKSLALDQSYKESWRDLGDCYVENKEYKNAIEPYENAITLFKLDKKDSTELSSIYLKLGDVYKKTNNITKAKSNFSSAVKWNNANNTASMQQANVLYYNKKYKEALPYFGLVVKNASGSDPTIIQDAYYKRGICYLGLLDSSNAIHEFDSSMAIVTLHSEAKAKLAEIYFTRKNYAQVLITLEDLPSILKNFDTTTLADLYYKKGVSNLMTNNPKNAAEDLEKAIQYENKSKNTYRYLALAYNNAEEYTKAETAFTKCIDVYKSEKDSLQKMIMYRAITRSKQKNYSEAIQDIEQVNKLRPNQPSVLTTLCQVYIESASYDKALNVCNQLFKLYKPTESTNLSKAYVIRSRCYAGLNQDAKSKADLAKAVSLYPENPEARQMMDQINTSNPQTVVTPTLDTVQAKPQVIETTKPTETPVTPNEDTTQAKPTVVEPTKPIEKPVTPIADTTQSKPTVVQPTKPIEKPVTPIADTTQAKPTVVESAKPIEKPVTPIADTTQAKPTIVEPTKPIEKPVTPIADTTQAKPTIVESAKPIEKPVTPIADTTQAKPTIVEPAKPIVDTTQVKPTIIEPTKPIEKPVTPIADTTQAKPTIVEPTKPIEKPVTSIADTTQAKPTIVEQAKPIEKPVTPIADTTQAKPTAVEPTKPIEKTATPTVDTTQSKPTVVEPTKSNEKPLTDSSNNAKPTSIDNKIEEKKKDIPSNSPTQQTDEKAIKDEDKAKPSEPKPDKPQ